MKWLAYKNQTYPFQDANCDDINLKMKRWWVTASVEDLIIEEGFSQKSQREIKMNKEK